jgi:3-oxoacyl-[acyl-carrier protein] reductase
VPLYPGLAGRVAFVTGGSRGIGAATCRALAANGVRVAVGGRDRDAIDTVVQELTASGVDALGVACDVCEGSQLEEVCAHIESELGPVSILAPFAGGFESYTPVHEIEEDEWRTVIEVNLTATFLTVRAFVGGMIERRNGAIVTMASNAGRLLDSNLTASYAAAKAGVIMFTRHAARELGPYGIRVNCIAPSTTLSERIERIMTDDRRADLAAKSPLGRLGTPEDSALAALFLVSDSASWLTGLTIDVSGGRVML